MFDKFKPMLAKEVDLDLLDFGNREYLASRKLDGIRCTILDGKVYSRSKKMIPNASVQKRFGRKEFNGLDGELIVGQVNSPDVYRNTNSGVMSVMGDSGAVFHVFDDITYPDLPFKERLAICNERIDSEHPLYQVHQYEIFGLEDIDRYEDQWLNQGFEGLMLRDANMPYKFGRSTTRQQHLLKVKRFADSEAIVVGVDPLYQNNNEATIDALGHTVRSSHQENKVSQELLGRLQVEDAVTGIRFYVGTGFNMEDRKTLWYSRDELVGRMIKYKFFPVGMKDGVPRHPVYLGFRDEIDL